MAGAKIKASGTSVASSTRSPPKSRKRGSDEVFGTSAEDYFDAMPGGGQLANDLRRSSVPAGTTEMRIKA